MNHRHRHLFRHYFVAFLAVAVALVGAIWIPPFKERGGFLLLMLGVTISTWYGGFGPGLFAIVLAAVGGVLFLNPEGQNSAVQENLEEVFRVSLFVSVAFLINTLQVARERAERSVRDTDHRLGFALRAAAVACWDADLIAGTFWCSANLSEIFGRSPEAFPKTLETYFAMIHPQDVGRVRESLMREAEFDIEHRIVLSDGRAQNVATRGRLIRDKNGKPSHLVATVATVGDSGAENLLDSVERPILPVGSMA